EERARNDALTLSHGYEPERGFIKYRWQGYSEGLLLYILGLGSPTQPLSPESYDAWTKTYRWRRIYDFDVLYAGPLFIHQFLHVWIDFRGLQDAYMKEKSSDYFENSRRATYIQSEYCRRNPRGLKGYSELNWGITACDGPGPGVRKIDGSTRRFFGYHARGVPYGPDDGTISAGAAAASLPFAPEIVLPTIEHFVKTDVGRRTPCGFAASFNPMFPDSSSLHFWRSKYNFGLNHGPLIVMIENFRSGLIWRLMRNCRPVVRGLQRAGFSGAWLPRRKLGIATL
ncbi:MAG TPA: glucoamylase family protein, partial [Candidatus Saccharimonadales bacterium]|nr:glucoamylase family protein [Candidatus Saccharimonadales bacterium]